jgi:hypothetical protein
MVLLEASRIVWSEPESAEWPDDGAQPHPVAGREVGDGMSIHKIVERLGVWWCLRKSAVSKKAFRRRAVCVGCRLKVLTSSSVHF